jgi:hypothetical protein
VEIALIRQREIGRLRPSAGDEATLLVNEPESIWFVVGLQILGNAADHGVPRVASKYTVRSVQTRASSLKNYRTHIFQTLQRTHHVVDGGFRHPADLFNKRKRGVTFIGH